MALGPSSRTLSGGAGTIIRCRDPPLYFNAEVTVIRTGSGASATKSLINSSIGVPVDATRRRGTSTYCAGRGASMGRTGFNDLFAEQEFAGIAAQKFAENKAKVQKFPLISPELLLVALPSYRTLRLRSFIVP